MPPPRFARFSFHRASVAFVAALTLLGCNKSGPEGHGAGPGGMPPATVSVEKIATSDLPAVFEYVGETAGSRDVEVRARVNGILLRRNFVEGRPVKQGESLYTLDPAPFQAALNRVDADVAAAEARLNLAGRTVARLKPLWEAKVVSQRDFDDATAAEAVARAEVKSKQAERAEAALNLQYTKVQAPISGVASRSQVSEGTLVSGPDVLLTTVMQTDPIKVRFGIADTDQLRWRTEAASGQLRLPPDGAFDVEVTLSDGSLYPVKGKLLFSDTRVSGSTGTIEAEAQIPNPKGVLKPGQFVRVKLLGAVRPNAVRVPSRAVLEGPQGKYVYVVADGKAVIKPVQVGEQRAEGWIITGGLTPGDQLIVDGTKRIFAPNSPVQIAAPTPAAGAPGQPAANAAPASKQARGS